MGNPMPVGVFDSGLGGLTAVRAVSGILPDENIIYLGDTARLPYGTKSDATIVKYSLEGLKFLLKHGIKALIVACGTMSSVAADALTESSPVPVITVTKPAVKLAARGRRVGIIATKATVRSGFYPRELRRLNPGIETLSRACPLFVPLVENGRVKRGDAVIETVTAEYLKDIKDFGADALILGCTHYPLLSEVIGDYLGPGAELIDTGAAAAAELAAELTRRGELNDGHIKGQSEFYVTDDVGDFHSNALVFLGGLQPGLVSKCEI